jgi:hypothetical protein
MLVRTGATRAWAHRLLIRLMKKPQMRFDKADRRYFLDD